MQTPTQGAVPFAQSVYLNDALLIQDVLLGECELRQTYEYFQFTHDIHIPTFKNQRGLVTLIVPHAKAEALRTQINSFLVLCQPLICRIESDQLPRPFIVTGYAIGWCQTHHDRINTHLSFRLEQRVPA